MVKRLNLKLAACAIACAAAVVVPAVGVSLAGQGVPVEHESGTVTTASISPVPIDKDRYVKGELIVELSDAGTSGENGYSHVKEAISDAGFKVLSTLSHASAEMGTVLLVKTGAGQETGEGLEAAAHELASIPGSVHVQPNYRYSSDAMKATDLAADRDVGEQWYLNGADEHGARVAEAWARMTSSDKVDVAVLDTGMYAMPVYNSSGVTTSADNLHQEFDSSNLNLSLGADFVHTSDGAHPLALVNDSNPYGDDNGHGTHVAGIIAASARTALNPDADPNGMAGVSQNARIVPIKVLDDAGDGDAADFIAAYDYLLSKKTEGGALENLRVVNMSFSLTFDDEDADNDDGDDGQTGYSDDGLEVEVADTDYDDETLRKKIAEAANRGVVTVCAAGNEKSAEVTFPSDYKECVSVTALDCDGSDASFSNINEYKDISAPGVGIFSAWGSQADAYAVLSGTSQASAIVSGVFSMLFAEHPALTVQAAKDSVYQTATAVPQAERAPLQTSAVAGGGDGLAAISLQSVTNGSHGAIDAAAALDYSARYADGSEPDHDVDGKEPPFLGELPSGGDPIGEGEKGDDSADSDKSGGDEAHSGNDKPEGSKAPDGGAPERIPIASGSMRLAHATVTFTGQALEPGVIVEVGGNTLKQGSDFTVSYLDNVNPGTAWAVVTGSGSYTDTLTQPFRITLGTTKVGSLKSAKKALIVKWSRQASGNVGYHVRYSAKKSMKGAKTRTVKKNATTKLKIAKLKSGKRYYVQVRTFKKVNGKTYCSAWSPKKSVKVR